MSDQSLATHPAGDAARPDRRSLAETRAFFGPRAADWEVRFPDDGPCYRQAVLELAPPLGGTVLDVGCGTGRALPPLREAVGPTGRVVGLDATPEMLAEAKRLGRGTAAALLLGDGRRLPLPDAALDAVFAGGFIPHLVDPTVGLAELARVTRRGGRLAVFHPIGRVALAARHGGAPTDDDAIAPARLTRSLEAAGWAVDSIDDAVERYLALATRA